MAPLREEIKIRKQIAKELAAAKRRPVPRSPSTGTKPSLFGAVSSGVPATAKEDKEDLGFCRQDCQLASPQLLVVAE